MQRKCGIIEYIKTYAGLASVLNDRVRCVRIMVLIQPQPCLNLLVEFLLYVSCCTLKIFLQILVFKFL